jgi:hypothetical protein
MDHEQDQADGRKPYEPPQLMTISLRPEEAVLGSCKTSSGMSGCDNPCANLLCVTVGS